MADAAVAEEATAACRAGALERAQRALQDADASFEQQACLREAAEHGHADLVRWLLTRPEVDPCAIRNKAVRAAAENGHLGVLQVLRTDYRVDPSDLYNWAVIGAAMNGHLECLQVLLAWSRSVDPSAENSAAIGLAAKSGHLHVVRCLLEDDRVDVCADDCYALRIAARNGHLCVVEALLELPQVFAATPSPSALEWACEGGHVKIVQKLLKASPRVAAENGQTALRAALGRGQIACAYEVLKCCGEHAVIDHAVLQAALQCKRDGGADEGVALCLRVADPQLSRNLTAVQLREIVSPTPRVAAQREACLAVVAMSKTLHGRVEQSVFVGSGAAQMREGLVDACKEAHAKQLEKARAEVGVALQMAPATASHPWAAKVLALAFGHRVLPVAWSNAQRYQDSQSLFAQCLALCHPDS